MTKTALFSEFTPVTAKQWKQKIQYDLKGADYNDTLVWESIEGIKVKPFYNAEDVSDIPKYRLPKKQVWNIGEYISVTDAEIANKKAKQALNKGAEAIYFVLETTPTHFTALFHELLDTEYPIHLDLTTLEVDGFEQAIQELNPYLSKIHLHIDTIGHLAKSGNWYLSMEKDKELLKSLLDKTAKNHVGLSIDASIYGNAGANCVQQLAYALAHTTEYLNQIENPINLNTTFAVGGNYFFEIAKLRAYRWLWESLQIEHNLTHQLRIIAKPATRNKTIYDYNVNLLRTSTECMAAVLGGADMVVNHPYDLLYKYPHEFSERIARNQLLLLKEEAYFNNAPASTEGSYFLDSLTYQLAQKALELYQQIEASGGFLVNLKKGIIQKKVKEVAEKEQQLFDDGILKLIGTNLFQNKADKMGGALDKNPFLQKKSRKTLIPPIVATRLAEKLEKKRLENE